MDNNMIAPVKEYHQITIDEYLMAKQEIVNRLMNMSEDYIAIGFFLRQIDESEAYRQEGYASLKEFAKAEFGLSESSVSRAMAINKEFSKDGYSKELSSEYRGYGTSKLAEMLSLSEDDRRLVTPNTTVKQVRELKEFNREAEAMQEEQEQNQEQIPGQQNVEEMIEAYERGEFKVGCDTGSGESISNVAQVPVPLRTWSDLETVLIEFFRDKEKLLNEIYSLSLSTYEDVVEKLNPSGNLSFRYKTLMLFMYGYGDGVALKKMGAATINHTWPDVIQTIVNIYKDTYTDHDTVYQNFYSQKPVEEPEPAEPVKQDEAPKAAEYETPHPEYVTSICYSCTEYETCNVKKSTCTSCDQYKNRAEENKTDEQRYDEEQAKIDKETAKKLKEKADEEKMEKLPSERTSREQQVHEVKLGIEFFEEALSNRKTFELRKNDREYRVGDLLEMKEYSNGAETGRTLTKYISYILEDYTGLMEGYCILATVPVNENDAPLKYADLEGICRGIRGNSNGYTEGGDEYIITEDAVGLVRLGGIYNPVEETEDE